MEKIEKYPGTRVAQGVDLLIEQRKSAFFPTVGEILEFIRMVPTPEATSSWKSDAADAGGRTSGTFRGGVLAGERWTEEDLASPKDRPDAPNRVVLRAAAAMDAKIAARFGRGPSPRDVGLPAEAFVAVLRPVAPRRAAPVPVVDEEVPDWA